jgi:predicted PurR-regulated permease PerM
MTEEHPITGHTHFRLWFWVGGALLFLWFLILVKSILLPFVVGMFAAYFLDPAVRRLRGWGWSRGTSAAVITIGFFALAIGLCMVLVPLVTHQFVALLKDMPDYINGLQTRYGAEIQHYIARLGTDQVDTIKDSLGSYSGQFMGWVGQMASGALQSGLALLNILSLVFITPIVAFYLLRDWHMVVARFYALLPRENAYTIRDQLHAIDRTLSGFIRGQTNVCLILASYYGILLSLVGLNFGLLIGIMTGFLLFIPFVGFICCFVLSVIVALFQFPDNAHVIAVLAIYGIGVALESGVITPRLVGGKVGLHPLWIIFGMLAGAALFGFVGILISVPVTAVVGVLVRFAIVRYLHSSLYRGEPHSETP